MLFFCEGGRWSRRRSGRPAFLAGNSTGLGSSGGLGFWARDPLSCLSVCRLIPLNPLDPAKGNEGGSGSVEEEKAKLRVFARQLQKERAAWLAVWRGSTVELAGWNQEGEVSSFEML